LPFEFTLRQIPFEASCLTPADESQLLNYLAMTRLERGLLINFGSKSLEYKRRVM